jgi:hypothetical protein
VTFYFRHTRSRTDSNHASPLQSLRVASAPHPLSNHSGPRRPPRALAVGLRRPPHLAQSDVPHLFGPACPILVGWIRTVHHTLEWRPASLLHRPDAFSRLPAERCSHSRRTAWCIRAILSLTGGLSTGCESSEIIVEMQRRFRRDTAMGTQCGGVRKDSAHLGRHHQSHDARLPC